MAEPYAVWLDRDVVTATGPQAAVFLQGQLSQDVLALGDGAASWSWVLAPTGKVDALVRVARLAEDAWLLDTDAGWGQPLVTRLNRFKLRTKVELEARPWQVLGLRGGEAEVAGQPVVVDAWPHLDGVDLLGERLSVPEHWRIMGADEYEAVRIAAGVPKMGAELTERTIPAETGLIDQTVSFTKGCYTGQELVARIDSRGGHVPRHLRGLLPAAPIEAGTELVDSSGRTAGTVTSAAPCWPSGEWVGLGYVRRGVDIPSTLWATGRGPEVGVRELPL